jgi:octaprenyl-diphosphate synthase
MWQERQAELLRGEIKAVLASLSDIAGFFKVLEEPLTKARRGLSGESARDRPWPLLPLMVCEAISGHYKYAIPVAAGLQLLMAAGDVFDDIEDADSSESLSAKYGPAVATNVATTHLILAEKAITRLKTRGVADGIIIRVMNAVNSYYTITCAGQHLDLSHTSKLDVSENLYLKIISMKSASQIECACHIGALLATNNQVLVDIYSQFGHNLGMAAQITNDIQGVIHGNDIQKKKMTLPVIYALAQTNNEVRKQFEIAFGETSESESDPTQIRELLFRAGAIHYATIIMERYKQYARNILSMSEDMGVNTQRLKLLLE